jgi:uncharacterized protein YceH (UPF0502 family)
VKIKLAPYEARIMGVLIEKEITTPDQYPLSLNALTAACNQKSNRDPVLELDEATVQQTVDGLVKKYLVSNQAGYGSRVTKYQHRFCNTEFGDLKLSPQELGVICELLLRGPQTPGELRTRAERLCKFGDAGEVEAALANLMARDEPLVVKLPREPGKRESRYAHLLGGDISGEKISEGESLGAEFPGSERERLDALEQLVRELRQDIDVLKERYERLSGVSEQE